MNLKDRLVEMNLKETEAPIDKELKAFRSKLGDDSSTEGHGRIVPFHTHPSLWMRVRLLCWTVHL